ncbi:MAG: hypothetical protein BYD32DRAFT_54365 [Podila humilis]|nr:MAG: hypothetical protein BYD32DRAFT_54365 [Podila humilis]
MGWTDTEQLLCVLEDGLVRMYNILGEYTQFSLGKVNLENLNEMWFRKNSHGNQQEVRRNKELNEKPYHFLFP